MKGNSTKELRSTDSGTITAPDIVLATLYTFVAVFGVVGNTIVITITRRTPSMRTTKNYLFLNLAEADIVPFILCPWVYDSALPTSA